MSVLAFTVLGEAVPKGRARAFNTQRGIRFHTPAKTAGYEQQVRVLAQEAIEAAQREAPHVGLPVPVFPLSGPLALSLAFYRGVPRSWSGKKRAAALRGESWPESRPDVDNLAKCIKDALNEVAWHDDAQIVSLQATKWFGEQPLTLVRVARLDAKLVERLGQAGGGP